MKRMQQVMMAVAMMLTLIIMVIEIGGCEQKPQVPSPQEADDLHDEAEEEKSAQDYLETVHLQKVAQAAAEIVEAENVYEFTFLLADVNLWDADSAHFALVEQMIAAWYEDDRDLKIRQRALVDELCVAIATRPDLSEIYEVLEPEEVLQVHGVIMRWWPSSGEDTKDDSTDTADRMWYCLVDESGDGVWDWAVCSEDGKGEVKFKGAGGQCEFENVQAIDLPESWDGASVWDVEAMFKEE